MGLFQKEKTQKETNVDETSYMLAVPETKEEVANVRKLVFDLKSSRLLDVLEEHVEEEGGQQCLKVRVQIDGCEYSAKMTLSPVEIPSMYRMQHFFNHADRGQIALSKLGLMVEMEFTEDAQKSYHAQLKIIASVLPDVIAVLDISAEKILAGKWVRMAAESAVLPAPRYIFIVQAVTSRTGKVWLHTHGLNRCHLPELEILDSTAETYERQYNIIENTAYRMLEDGAPEWKEPLYLARVTDDIPLFVTLVSWEEALENYGRRILGGRHDRKNGHNGNTCCIFCYTTVDNLENRKYSSVKVFDDVLENNPLYMITNRETARMKALALERLQYMKDMLGRPDTLILTKIGLEVDDEYKDDQNSKEHIWFELKEAKDGQLTAELTQEPYYVSGLHQGDICTYPESALTDWLVMTKEGRYTPDDAYQMI
ncbi:MAG: DUF4026 domain-containing protein [Ruminococcus flavefaciens]|nr:DUF4026 domain-containing protein [Ruminococcus flavefaciens]